MVGKSANDAFGWTVIPRELRVRTSIDADTLRATEKQLFAYQMVIPDHHEWLAYLDLRDVPRHLRRRRRPALTPDQHTKNSEQ